MKKLNLTKKQVELLAQGAALTREVENLMDVFEKTDDTHFLNRALMVSDIMFKGYTTIKQVLKKKKISYKGFDIEYTLEDNNSYFRTIEKAKNNDERFFGSVRDIVLWIEYKHYEWTDIEWIRMNYQESIQEVQDYMNKHHVFI